ncbi:hypothetical protein BJV78DRAFT_133544 [Lactifluus subvellereus]|nr:hypothetical protein BJV78DRAFT_133544 [Lactifluus subvellereus]
MPSCFEQLEHWQYSVAIGTQVHVHPRYMNNKGAVTIPVVRRRGLPHVSVQAWQNNTGIRCRGRGFVDAFVPPLTCNNMHLDLPSSSEVLSFLKNIFYGAATKSEQNVAFVSYRPSATQMISCKSSIGKRQTRKAEADRVIGTEDIGEGPACMAKEGLSICRDIST